jgi:ligand-binding sensor domain-containing protein
MSFWRAALTLSAVLVIVFLNAQERQLGTWKAFTPYGASLAVCNVGERVFSASLNSIFSVDKNTGEIRTYDKASGLSDIGVKMMNYDPATEVLAIAYNNSNIDLIYHETEVYNLPDFKLKNTSGSVGINGLSFYEGNCYVSSDMGVSVIDLAKKEIKNTYIIGSTGQQVKVYATTANNNEIFAATQEGVKHASLTSTNLQNFNSWTLFNYTNGIPAKKAKLLATHQNKVYAVIDGNGTDTLYAYAGGTWSVVYFATEHVITNVSAVNGNLYFAIWNNDNTTAGKHGKIDASGILSINDVQGHVRPSGWFESNGIAWEGDYWNGLFKNNQGNLENIRPDGPFSASVFRINIADGKVNVAPGGVDDSWEFIYNRDGFFVYENNQWTNVNQYNNGVLLDWSDILAVTSAPARGKTYFGSFFAGLIEYDHNTKSIIQYNKWNSILEGAVGDTQRTKISSLATDRNGNVWIGNAGATKPIKMIPANGSDWKEFSTPYSFSLMKRILIDANGQLWAPVRRSGEGVLVWSNNNTLNTESDDKARLLLTGKGAGGLPDAYAHCIAEDKDGNIWVGTNQGIGIFYCPGSVLTNYGCDADQIKVERDGYIGYLFGTESVRAIAVDAANRKWIGTTNGLWLISADGKKELLKFTADNSPLPANQITDIAIDDKTGEVFIGTTGGLVSYQSDAMGDCADCETALVYPNPVKPDYDGPIAIKGLVEDAYVKITDVSGTLVYQGRANGSQMIWDGKGYNGQRAKSGVYLVFSSTDLGKEKRVAKILLVN